LFKTGASPAGRRCTTTKKKKKSLEYCIFFKHLNFEISLIASQKWTIFDDLVLFFVLIPFCKKKKLDMNVLNINVIIVSPQEKKKKN